MLYCGFGGFPDEAEPSLGFANGRLAMVHWRRIDDQRKSLPDVPQRQLENAGALTAGELQCIIDPSAAEHHGPPRHHDPGRQARALYPLPPPPGVPHTSYPNGGKQTPYDTQDTERITHI